MATQHPDNAGAPFWEQDGDGFISIHEELDECVSCFQKLSVDEFMWDWEGKYADEAVVEKLFSNYYDFFKKKQLSKDIFLTFRLPNIWHEKGYSLLRALMVILTSEDLSHDLKLKRPLFEVILPMTEKAEQLLYIQNCFTKLARFKSKEFKHQLRKNSDYLEIIPLVEDVAGQVGIRKILDKYVELHQKQFKNKPKYLRVFLARSDPALSSGLVANVLANKIALSEIEAFGKDYKMPVHPIIGAGGLVFRGGLNPENVKNFVKQYQGVKTVTIQSSFRYDYPLSKVKKSIEYLQKKLPLSKAVDVPLKDAKVLKKIINLSKGYYNEEIAKISQDMIPFFDAVPRRRERRLHIGFLSYKRKVAGNNLPRAIAFTAAFYSIGVPPEFIGLGKTLKELSDDEFKVLYKYYPYLKNDIQEAGRYLNKENLTKLVKKNSGWKDVMESIRLCEEKLDIELGPKSKLDCLHKNITANVLILKKNKERVHELMIETGKIRKSLG